MNLGNVLILGDSFSTFQGYIPEGYLTYYGENTDKNTAVRKVEYTWWHRLMQEVEMNLVLNNSWSGSTICYTGYDNYDCSKDSSFIFRLRQLIDNGFFEKNEINTVFLFGASNDSGANSPLGEIKYDNFEEKDLYFALPAISYIIKLLKETVPNAAIYFPINDDIKPEIRLVIPTICEHYGVKAIPLKNIEKLESHPTIEGMIQMKDQILEAVSENA